jgi:predicted Zn-dependent peptidase
LRAAFLALPFAILACAPAAPPPPSSVAILPVAPAPPIASAVTDESFRAQPPEPEAPHPFVLPPTTHLKLRNGIPVTVVQQPSPLVAVHIAAAGGALDVGPSKIEVVLEMLRSIHAGTEKLSYQDLRKQIASLSMPEPEATWRRDAISIAGVVPVAKVREGIALLADLALRPSFDKVYFERWREQDAIAADRRSDGALANDVLRRVLFGSHGYAAGLASAARTRAVTRPDIVALHARVFEPSRLSITVAGGADPEVVASALEDALGAAPRHPGPAPALAVPPPPSGPRLTVVDKPGTTIATISVGALGPAYASADVGPSWLDADALLDGAFGRLPRRLSEQVGDVPHVTWGCEWMRLAGEITWQTRVPSDRVAPVLVEMDRSLRELGTNGPTEDELADVKARRMLAFAAWFETAAVAASALSVHAVYQQPEEMLAKFPDRFAAVSTGEARTAAARWLSADRVQVVIVGDWAKLQTSVNALGWGPIEARTVDGDLATPARERRATRAR